MRLTKKFWIGPLMAVSVLLAAIAAGQTSPTLKGDNQRSGHNGTPLLTHPGRGFLTWFRPNANDAVTGTIIRNNTAQLGQVPPNVTFTAGFVGSPLADLASFVYDQPSYGDQASDLATGAYATYVVPPFDGRTPSYHYTNTVVATSVNNPAAGATQSFTWYMDPTKAPISQAGTGVNFARNYALYANESGLYDGILEYLDIKK